MATTVIKKEMGLTHADFYRDIERVLGIGGYQRTENGVSAENGDMRLQIALAEQTQRKISLFILPVTPITFTFDGYGADDIKAFMKLYDRVFRRGGG